MRAAWTRFSFKTFNPFAPEYRDLTTEEIIELNKNREDSDRDVEFCIEEAQAHVVLSGPTGRETLLEIKTECNCSWEKTPERYTDTIPDEFVPEIKAYLERSK